MNVPNEAASPASKRHSRNISHNRILPRRSTKGPLDTDDPLTAQTSILPVSGTQSTLSSQSDHTQDKDLSYLLLPSNFHPLPPALIPPPPPTQSSSPSSLFTSNQFHAAASAASQRLAQPPPPPNREILSLLYIRFASLVKCQLLSLALAEIGPLGDISSPLYRAFPQDPSSSILPWELRIFVLSLQSIQARDLRPGNGPGTFYDLGREARLRYRNAETEAEKTLWKSRMGELAWMTVNALVEEGDMNAALRLMRDLRTSNTVEDWGSRMILLYLKVGDVEGAKKILFDLGEQIGERRKSLEALIRVCEGDYDGAARFLDAQDAVSQHANNFAVTCFYSGSIDRCLQMLDQAVIQGDASRGIVFNLATCYELLMERSVKDRKEALLANVRGQAGADRAALTLADFKI